MGRQRARVGFPRAHTLLFFPVSFGFGRSRCRISPLSAALPQPELPRPRCPGGVGFVPKTGRILAIPQFLIPSFLIFFFKVKCK